MLGRADEREQPEAPHHLLLALAWGPLATIDNSSGMLPPHFEYHDRDRLRTRSRTQLLPLTSAQQHPLYPTDRDRADPYRLIYAPLMGRSPHLALRPSQRPALLPVPPLLTYTLDEG